MPRSRSRAVPEPCSSLFVLSLLLGLGACRQDAAPAIPPQATSTATVPAEPMQRDASGVELQRLQRHVQFLADDAQQGRPPGTEADARVQAYLVEAMKAAGLEPGFGDDYLQSFEVTDGIGVKDGGEAGLGLGEADIPTSLLPFSTDTAQTGPVQAKLVFVGYGIATDGPATGDYSGLAKKVEGKIVVALPGGPADADLSEAALRPQTKAITAREHGAAGFLLWDPTTTTAFPNHGQVNDSRLPALFVGSDANAALVRAFTGRKDATTVDPSKPPMKRGAVSRAKAKMRTDIEPVVLKTANVAGVVPGNGSSDKVLVVGAHMDHLGLGTASSLAPGERAVHNGADDNASGVAAMLEVCRALAELPQDRRAWDVQCVAFAAEEMGLLGSKYLVEQLDDADKKQLVAMINFDMVGRLRAEGVMIAGVGTSSIWPDLVESHRGELIVRPTEDGYGPSDHGSFYEVGVPVLHFFTGPHEDYHRPSDDVDKINFEGAQQVAGMALSIAASLLEQQPEIDYQKTKRSQKVGPRSFKVSLGTVPDYAAEVDGVRLSGVRPGGAAEQAGLQAGDVITKIGEREIHNFDDFMAMFAVLEPGKTVKVVATRDGKPIELELTPGAPRPR